MAAHTTNKILLEFEVNPERTLAVMATVLVPVLEATLTPGSNFRPVCPELVSETVNTFIL